MRVECTLLCTFNHWTIMPESTWLRCGVAFSAAWAGLVSSHQNWPGLNINNSNNNGHWTSEHGAVVRWWRLQLGHNRLARVISYYWYRLITRRWWAACAGMTRLPSPSPSLPPQIMILFSSHNSCHSGGGRHAAAASLHPSHHPATLLVNRVCLKHKCSGR